MRTPSPGAADLPQFWGQFVRQTIFDCGLQIQSVLRFATRPAD
jgi:hypothetical protein